MIGAVVLDFCVRRFMGMARFTVARNQQFEQNYPVDIIIWTAAGILILLTFIAIVLFLRQALGRSLRTWIMMILALAFTIVFVGFVFSFNSSTLRSYYYVVLLLGLTAYIQSVKAIVNEATYHGGNMGRYDNRE